MTFFESAMASMPQPPEAEPEQPSPAWLEPPTGIVPAQSTQRVVLFRTERAILTVGRLEVYPTGVEFALDLRIKPPGDELVDMPWDLNWRPNRRSPQSTGALPDDFLRFGFVFADGTTWTNFGLDVRSFDDDPVGPVVIRRGGGGSGGRWSMRYWMWPLPPAGDVVVYAQWPSFDIGEVSAVFDGSALRRDAEAAELIWE